MKTHNLGIFEMMSEDLTAKFNGRVVSIFSGRGGSWEKMRPDLVEAGWRVPNINELWAIGELALLGVGGLKDIEDPSGKMTGDQGYWSSTQPSHWEKMSIYLSEEPSGERTLGEISSPIENRYGPTQNRIRLVRDIKN